MNKDKNKDKKKDKNKDAIKEIKNLNLEVLQLEELEGVMNAKSFVQFDPKCIRQKSNWSKASAKYRFDNVNFSPKELLKVIPSHSPKLSALLSKIGELDAKDQSKYGKKFKHFIFSDLKSAPYGVKMIASALIAKGMKLGYTAKTLNPDAIISKREQEKEKQQKNQEEEEEEEEEENEKKIPQYGPMELLSEEQLLSNKGKNFYLLSSTSVYDKPITVKAKKSILATFNKRDENIYGDLARIIILDSGFKEGIDLFDVKYIHIFEPSVNSADQKQVIGRGTRTCGQKGLDFHPRLGWPLQVFIYDLSIPTEVDNQFMGAKTAFDLYMKSMNVDIRLFNLMNDIEKITVFGSVDYELNQNIHSFSIDFHGEEDENSIVYGGNTRRKPRTRKQKELSPVNSISSEKLRKIKQAIDNIGFVDLRNYKDKGFLKTKDRFILRKTARKSPEEEGKSPRDFIKPNDPIEIIRRVSDLTAAAPLLARPILSHNTIRSYIRERFSEFKWGEVKMENQCSKNEPSSPSVLSTASSVLSSILPLSQKEPVNPVPPVNPQELEQEQEEQNEEQEQQEEQEETEQEEEPQEEQKEEQEELEPEPEEPQEEQKEPQEQKGGNANSQATAITYTPTQNFIKHYFTPQCPVKGMLLWHSVGTGKTCSAIAAASSSFEDQGYTILWVTRTTLKNDIWKNMFSQVCNEPIRRKIQQGIQIPNDPKKQMRLLSKSWRIRPISYKQFSNLVSKQNDYYKRLVKENGTEDPLRKTLLIIDEAHKLYGGGSDLSSIERPDMSAFHEALMRSYAISGENSVRLLLMTATPITENPLEIVQLLNLCKHADDQIPTTFEAFASTYLKESGEFSERGREKYLDDIAGHVSYLNREKDARQFAQPIIHHIRAPIIDNLDHIQQYDRQIVRDQSLESIQAMKGEMDRAKARLQSDISKITPAKFVYLTEQCDTKASKKSCLKIVKRNVKELVEELKSKVADIKDQMKSLGERYNNLKELKNQRMQGVKQHMRERGFENYKNGVFYTLRKVCGTRIQDEGEFQKYIATNPDFLRYNERIESAQEQIETLSRNLRNNVEIYKKRLQSMKKLLKDSTLSDLEKNVVRLTISEEQKHFRKNNATFTKKTKASIENLKNEIKNTEKERKFKVAHIRKTLKKQIVYDKSQRVLAKKIRQKMHETLRKKGKLSYNNDTMDNLIKSYESKIQREVEEDQVAQVDIRVAKEEAKARKTRDAQEKKMKKEEERLIKQKKREDEKVRRDEMRIIKAANAKTRKAAKKVKGVDVGPIQNLPTEGPPPTEGPTQPPPPTEGPTTGLGNLFGITNPPQPLQK
jgi:hypothetical protein